MAEFCSNCGRQMRDDMRFCPTCGHDLSTDEQMGAQPPMAAPQVAPQFPPMPQGPGYMPMAPYPNPAFYRPPMSGLRLSSMSGAIILLIDAILALLISLLLLVDWWLVWLGVFMLVASVMAIISSVVVFLSFNPMYIIPGPVMLIMGALLLLVFEPDVAIVSPIGITLAVISTVLLVIGWRDTVSRSQARRAGMHPAMAGYHQQMANPQVPVYGGIEPPSVLNLRK